MFYYKFNKENDRNSDILIFANKNIYEKIEKDAIKQLFNTSKLPKVKLVVGMPDIHIGYGLPIGGIFASDAENGIVSPGAVGFDINCGVRLLKTDLNKNDTDKDLNVILNHFKNRIPAGLGENSNLKFTQKEFKDLVEKGVPYLINKFGLGKTSDIDNIEDHGSFPNADLDKVSNKAISRGITQLGSLGSGNHFIELQYIDKVFDSSSNFKEGQITVMIHTGSRGFGHQIAKDYIDKALNQDIDFPVKNLAYFNINSTDGQNYLKAMAAAANFAYVNRQILYQKVNEILNELYPGISTNLFYDLTHNIARFERHSIDNSKKDFLIHRKGTTRLDYNSYSLLPGSMGTASYVIKSANSEYTAKSLKSIAHGSGRVMGRREAKRTISKKEHLASLNKVKVTSSSGDSLLDESPLVYKDIEEVISSIIETKLALPVARLKPLAVLKG